MVFGHTRTRCRVVELGHRLGSVKHAAGEEGVSPPQLVIRQRVETCLGFIAVSFPL